jgi:hypothetical protein
MSLNCLNKDTVLGDGNGNQFGGVQTLKNVQTSSSLTSLSEQRYIALKRSSVVDIA